MAQTNISTNDCWLYAGYLNPVTGYGQIIRRIKGKGKGFYPHRLMYEDRYGPIPESLVTDHLCRMRHCVNPEHMELVTNRENVLRGNGITAREAKQTHCKRGHEFRSENVYIRKGKGWRICRLCRTHRA